MTNQQHPLTPPPELVKQLARSGGYHVAPSWLVDILTASYQAGADQELEACLSEMITWGAVTSYGASLADDLRTARRQKPPSLAEEALEVARIELTPTGKNGALIIKALERLKELEEQQ